MLLTETSAVPGAALPLAAFKEHLRLGSGFADDGAQDALLERYLCSALAAIEARISKVLLERGFRLRLSHWREGQVQTFPVAPVSAVSALTLIDAEGAETAVEPDRWTLEPDMHRPRLRATGWVLPTIPTGGAVEIAFEAGFGPSWEDVPADLAQAVFMLAAQYHETRQASGPAEGVMPFGVMTLIERWRNVRSLAGGAR